LINNKNIINIVESKRSGAQIPFSHYLPPDRYDRTPYADPKIDRTLLLLENQKRDYDVFKTDLIKSQMNNIKTITDTINNTPNAELERLTSLAMKYLPNEFEDQQAGVPQEQEFYQWIDSDDESTKAEPQPQKTPEPQPQDTPEPPPQPKAPEPPNIFKNLNKPKQPFKCKICNREFVNKQGLFSHERAHERDGQELERKNMEKEDINIGKEEPKPKKKE
jgi:hypothetical protein